MVLLLLLRALVLPFLLMASVILSAAAAFDVGVLVSDGALGYAGRSASVPLIPFVPLIQVGMIIAFGVLLDTFIVRSIIVPAIVWDIGNTVWWPARAPASGNRSVTTSLHE